MKNYTFFTLQILLSSLILLLVTSCKRDANSGDEPLCSARSNNNSISLRLGGMYYFQSDESSERVSVYLLNANGTVGRSSLELPLSSASSQLISNSFMNYMSDNKGYWGVFNIEGAKIVIDTWHVDSNGKDYGYRWSGDILSDTSFRITSSALCDGSEYSAQDKLYYFYPLTSKPDSVTSLIP